MSGKFWRTASGNVAMLFGLLIVPLLLGAGVAIDLFRADQIRSAYQDAADSAVLAAARAKLSDQSLTDEEAEDIARRYFDANVGAGINGDIAGFVFSADPSTGSFTISVSADVKTTLMKVGGLTTLSADTTSVAKVTPGGPVEVVMVLDNTGSMSGAKLSALKSAATSLVNKVLDNGDGVHKISLAPFAQYVNVGSSNYGAAWIDNSAIPDPPGPAWNGCVGSRAYPLNLDDAAFDTDPAPAVDVSECPQSILPLTSNKSQILSRINSMNAEGYTYIAAGLSWGYRLISNEAPFTEGLTTADSVAQGGTKAIVLLTDGANTRSASYPGHDSASESEANALTEEMCNNVKSGGVRLYTIVFDVSDSTIENLMQDCASSDGGYFEADDAGELAEAFGKIAISITDLALAR